MSRLTVGMCRSLSTARWLVLGGVVLASLAAIGVARAGPDGGCCGGGSAEGGAATAPEPAKGLLVDLGNTACPIMGGKVDGATFSEWNGLRIGHCCPGCVEEFGSDPAAALDKARIAWKDAAAAVKLVNGTTGAEREKALADLRAKWKVVREPLPPVEKPGLLIDLGNSACPILGGKPDGKTQSEWNGLRVGFCCPGCVAKFAKDPAAALDKAGIAYKDAAAAVKRVNDAKGEVRMKALADLRAKWTVVREPVAEEVPAAPEKQ